MAPKVRFKDIDLYYFMQVNFFNGRNPDSPEGGWYNLNTSDIIVRVLGQASLEKKFLDNMEFTCTNCTLEQKGLLDKEKSSLGKQVLYDHYNNCP